MKNDFDIVTEVICAFAKRPLAEIETLQNDFFQVNIFIKSDTFFLSIKPHYQIKLIANIFNLTQEYKSFTSNIDNNGELYVANATLALKSIIGFAIIGTIFAFLAINPLLEFVTAFVYNSGY